MCSPMNLWISPEGRRRRSVGWWWSPAVATMWRWGCRAAKISVAASASASVSMGCAVRAESSDQFGVIHVTWGMSCWWRISRASGGRSAAPEEARRIGSRIMGILESGGFPVDEFPSGGSWVARKPATDEAISLEPSIPILIPAGGRSSTR